MLSKEEIDKAKKELEALIKAKNTNYYEFNYHKIDNSTKIVLKVLKNSIPKEVLKEKLLKIHNTIYKLKDDYAIHQNDYFKNELDSIENEIAKLLEEN